MERPYVRTPYNYDRNAASVESGLRCEDATLTQQHQKQESDINFIVRRFGITGELPVNLRVPINAEFVDVLDYRTAQNKLLEAQAAFLRMPAEVRNRFRNDPGAFVDFCSDEKNTEEMRKLGLLVPAESGSVSSAEGSAPPQS